MNNSLDFYSVTMTGKVEKIACPICDWEPDPNSLWYCTCAYKWNTFNTGGVCPSCKKQWRTTQCLSCHKHSAHLDWYRDLPDVIQDELNKIKQNHLKTL